VNKKSFTVFINLAVFLAVTVFLLNFKHQSMSSSHVVSIQEKCVQHRTRLVESRSYHPTGLDEVINLSLRKVDVRVLLNIYKLLMKAETTFFQTFLLL